MYYDKFFKDLFIFDVYMCVSICVWHVCAGAHTEEGVTSSGT